jgi:hypothetical protein
MFLVDFQRFWLFFWTLIPLLISTTFGLCVMDFDLLSDTFGVYFMDFDLLNIMEPIPSTSRGLVDDMEPSTSHGVVEIDSSIAEKRRLYTTEILQGWNLRRLITELGTRQQCIAFAEQHSLLQTMKLCRYHKQPMSIDLASDNNVGKFTCRKGVCKVKGGKISRSIGTWFENVKLDLPHVFYIMYAYAHNWSHDKIIWEDILRDEKQKCLSRATITDWYSYCREAVVIYYLDKIEVKGKIGGPGKVVQIDESKFGKRKYNKGK